jgi:rhamnosyltransferase
MTKSYRCSLVIPTKDAGDLFKRVLAGLQSQTIWADVEFVIIDSGSKDDTVALARAAGATCISIPPSEFNHGATRDAAIAATSTNRIILLVQDATPNDAHLLETLVAALDEDNVAGVYARQIPYPDADVITARNLNMHLTGRMQRDVCTIADMAAYKAMTPMQRYHLCNFDNVCSAIRKDVWELEKFGRINFGEDIDWSERALKRGYKIVYEPRAAVIHSHDRPMIYEYKRTYVCHRKLYAQFGLQTTATIGNALHGWAHWSLRDMLYIARTEKDWRTRIVMILKTPILNFLRIAGQYQAVRDEKAGTVKAVRGV